MKVSADGVVRAVRGTIRTILSVGCLTLLSCSSVDDRPERPGTRTSPIIELDPPATIVAGEPSTRSATCPGHELPDQCGTWAGVELHATRTPDPRHGWHHHECRHHGHDHHTNVTTDDDEHCLCAPIDFVIPSELPVTAGTSGGDWDKAELSFRTAGGKVVECEYRGNYEAKHGKHPASGGDKYEFQRCTRGFKAGQSTQSDWFQLELGDSHGSKTNVEVSLRLGEPDVVGGVVQEQVFYADDARAPGAALHVPRGSAPDFESFSLDVVPQVRPGTAIENGGNSAIAAGYAVDVHSDTTDNFVFTPVSGTCPRIEVPYDPARLEALLGAGHESALNASHLTSVAAIAGGGHVLDPLGPVTVDLANHTLSFCVEHLSIYLGLVGTNNAVLTLAVLRDGATTVVKLVDAANPSTEATTLPTLTAGRPYSLDLTFLNQGTQWLSPTVKLVAVELLSPAVAGTTIVDGKTVSQLTSGTWTAATSYALPSSPIANASTASFTLAVTAPSPSKPLNFCLRSGSVTTNGYFGECFSWDAHRYIGGTGTAPPDVCVPTAEVCNGADDDCDGVVDDGVLNACNGCAPLTHAPGSICNNGEVNACARTGAYVCSGINATTCSVGPVSNCCGDGITTGGEACDDANTATGDGCSNACAVASGFVCAGSPSVCTQPPSCTGLATQCAGESCCADSQIPGDPAHSFSTFKLDKYEVTVGRFKKFVAAYDSWRSLDNPQLGVGAGPVSNSGWGVQNLPLDPRTYPNPPAWELFLPADAATLASDLLCSPSYQTYDGNNALPISCVNWFEAFAFCVWDGGRLPSEHEWEAAASNDFSSRYPWGAAPDWLVGDDVSSYAVFGGVSLVPVGSRPLGRNTWGQADMLGSTWEWVFDWIGFINGSRTLKGASARNSVGTLYATNRDWLDASGRQLGPEPVGFRCAR